MRFVFALVSLILGTSLVPACKSSEDKQTASPAGSAPATTDAHQRHVADLLVRLDVALRKRAPRILDRLRPGASEQQLADFEKYFGLRLPDTLRALYRWHDGVTTNIDGIYQPAEVYPGYWMNSLQQVRESHEMKTRMSKDGTYQSTGRGGAGWWDSRWIPVFENHSGGSLCVDMAGSFTGVTGQILQEWHDDSSRSVEYRSLDRWLETYVAALEAGVLQATSDEPTLIGASDLAGQEGPKHEHWLAYQQAHNPGYPQRFRAEGGH